MQPVSLKYF